MHPEALGPNAHITIRPASSWLVREGQMACQQGSTGMAECFNVPEVGSLRRDNQFELATFFPPLCNILHTGQPYRERSAMGIRQQYIKGLPAKDTTFRVNIQRVKATKIIGALHPFAPDASYFLRVSYTQTIKKYLIIWNTGRKPQ